MLCVCIHTLHYTELCSTTLHYTTLCNITLHLHYIILHYITYAYTYMYRVSKKLHTISMTNMG